MLIRPRALEDKCGMYSISSWKSDDSTRKDMIAEIM